MKKSKFTEEQIAYALRQVESGTPAGRRLPAARRQRSDLLHLEEEVRAPGRQRAAAAAVARGRECPAEAPGRRPVARQTHPDRGPAKKSLRPTQRRELAGWVQATFARQLRAGLSSGAVQSGGVVSPHDARTTRRRCGRASASSRTRGHGSAIRASGCCCDEKAGR